jgi:hypothetical protein
MSTSHANNTPDPLQSASLRSRGWLHGLIGLYWNKDVAKEEYINPVTPDEVIRGIFNDNSVYLKNFKMIFPQKSLNFQSIFIIE